MRLIAALLGVAAAGVGAVAPGNETDGREAPDLEFLESLGSWPEQDEEWLVIETWETAEAPETDAKPEDETRKDDDE